MEEVVNSLKQVIAGQVQQIEQLKAENEMLKKKPIVEGNDHEHIDELNEINTNLQNENSKLKKEIDRLKNLPVPEVKPIIQSNDEEIYQLQTALRSKDLEITSLKTKITSLQSTGNLEIKVKELESIFQLLNQELGSWKERYSELEKENKHLNEQINGQININLPQIDSGETSKLNAKISSLELEILHYQDIENEKKRLLTQYKNLENQLLQKTSELDRFRLTSNVTQEVKTTKKLSDTHCVLYLMLCLEIERLHRILIGRLNEIEYIKGKYFELENKVSSTVKETKIINIEEHS